MPKSACHKPYTNSRGTFLALQRKELKNEDTRALWCTFHSICSYVELSHKTSITYLDDSSIQVPS